MKSRKHFISVIIWIPLLIFVNIVYGNSGNETIKYSKAWFWNSPPSGTSSIINNLKDMWEPVEQQLESECMYFKNFNYMLGPKFVGENTPLPGECSNIALCNQVRCILLDRLSWMFSYTTEASAKLDIADKPKINITRYHYRIRSSYWQFLNATNWTDGTLNDDGLNITTIYDSVSFYSGVDVRRLPRLSETLNRTFDDKCQNAWAITDMVIFLENDLPIGCSKLMLCNGTLCFVTSLMSMQHSTVINRVTQSVENRPNDLPYCSSIKRLQQSRQRRRPILYPRRLEINSGWLSFNLPGYRFCGPGTLVCSADDNGGPVNELDAACRQHDLDYMMGIDPKTADRNFLRTVLNLDTPYYYLFAAIFEAKLFFEKIFGGYYTTGLYFHEKAGPSMVNNFYYSSVYDMINVTDANSVHYKLGKIKEERWTSIVHEIWRGSCYVQIYSPLGVNQQVSLSEAGNALPNANTGTQTSSQQPSTSSNCEPQSQPKNDVLYPVPPQHLKDCRIVISEIATGSLARNEFSFVELTKICSTKERNQWTSLKNYQLMLIEAGNPPKLLMHLLLTRFKMNSVMEIMDGKEKFNYYFIIGVDEMTQRDVSIPSHSSTIMEFPDGSTTTFAVVLLYVPLTVPQLPKLPLNPVVPYELQDVEINAITDLIQDVVVYGAPCASNACNTFKTWFRDPNGLVDVELVPVPEVTPNDDGTKPYLSLSRCTKSHFPMQNNEWDHCQPTPKRKNACVGLPNYPYSMRGTRLKESAQKLVLNVHHFFTVLDEEPDILTQSTNAVDRTAMATGLNPRVIRKIKSKHETGVIQTPLNRKRCRKSHIIESFDKFDIDVIKNIIQGYYQRNEPPFFDDIYTSSMTALPHSTTSAPGEQVKNRCSPVTFRRLLRKMGFKYGKIDTRVVILQRQDIVAKRWKYLEVIRRNDAGDKLPVIYTDETWIDTNARSGKAWVPRTGSIPYSEMKLYSYRKHKVSRGKRLIVLHAAGADGLVHEAMQVYPVGGSSVAADYHDNVSSDVYIDWITKLFRTLQEKGPHLVVIDNAPYHSKSDAPKSRDTKPVLLRWLTENDPNGTHTGFQQGQRYLKAELWEKVQVLKGIVDHYIIDKLAEQYGHKIVRLPPYNCDLNPIEELWHDLKEYVRKHNTEQTIAEVKRLAEQYLLTYTAQQFEAHIGHIKWLEEQYWTNDGFYDRLLDTFDRENRIIIPVREDDDERDDDDDDYGNENSENAPLISLSLEHNGERISFDENGELLDVEDSVEAHPASRRRLQMCD